ncbi:HU family DNA-binding protein [Bacillus wiedmannii]|uniref:HU family DNA-binding protein n=1 Tax=Bacillus wiedmannii TaxID=1890302 RepID=UPI003D9838A5
MDQITKALQQGEKVQLLVFETSEVHERAERNGRNPKTGEAMTILPLKVSVFKIGKELKYMVK